MHRRISFGFCLVLSFLSENVQSQGWKTIYQQIQEEEEFSGFNDLIRNNKNAKMTLYYQELTVFIPTNKAFGEYEDTLVSDIAFYHMSFRMKTLENLSHMMFVTSVNNDYPPLWMTKSGEELYVNNAKIINKRSDFLSRSKHTGYGKQQVLHVIDQVLDPKIMSPQYSYNAYDLLSSISKWRLGKSKTVTTFYNKVLEHKLSHLFKLEGARTYFIPVDYGINSYKFKLINKYVIFGHIIPNYVLFTRPTMKEFTYESMANDDFVYSVLSFQEIGDAIFVKGNTLVGNDSNIPKGEFYAKIVEANIPVKNGVVHLISQPLGIFNRTLKPFPYLPILEKITNDPTLDRFYQMGEKTGFNSIFSTNTDLRFTYFVAKDSAFTKLENIGLEILDRELDVLRRHLIVSETPYSMEQLVLLTQVNGTKGSVRLKSEEGTLSIKVFREKDKYILEWKQNYIRVLRPDYECTNGIVHILERPMANLKLTDRGNKSNVSVKTSDFSRYLGILRSM